VVVASANPDKAAEIRAIVSELLPEVELLDRPSEVPEVVEDGDTLLANARLKAEALASATGLPALADDTGLEVVALGGAPGVLTARWAGEHATYADNVAALLEALDGVEDRRARFRTVAMVRWPDGHEVAAEGWLDGAIAEAPRGTGGFGYDPVFVPTEADGRTFAELGPAAKNALSHRARALRALADELGADAR
jgi:XTP/dITP diphosphohydrolase